MTDLSTLRDRVEALLKDASNVEWTTAELDDAIRLALADLSSMVPARAVTTVDAVTDQWEYSLASVTGLVAVVEVWYPYLATDETYKKPHPVQWRMLDETTLLLDEDLQPETGYKLRVFYDKMQTLADLDSAASTTLNEQEKSVLIIGAAAYAALARARDVMGEVQIGVNTPNNLASWGKARMQEFSQKVYALSSLESAGDDARIGWWSTDKWDQGDHNPSSLE